MMGRVLLQGTLLLGLGLGAAGCIVEERIPGTGERVYHSEWEDDYEDQDELDLLEATEDEPESARHWWRLGDYYERQRRLEKALQAYLQMQERIEAVEQDSGRKYTGGLYVLGRVNARLKRWTQAVDYLGRVLAEQPKDLHLAVLNNNFAESHYLLGAIYYEHAQWKLAYGHLITFKEMTHTHRADDMLIEIDRQLGDVELQPSYQGESRPVEASQPTRPPEDGETNPVPPK